MVGARQTKVQAQSHVDKNYHGQKVMDRRWFTCADEDSQTKIAGIERKLPRQTGQTLPVTPQVFGFYNCIAFHKHEHHSSHLCLYFCLQHEYATYSNMHVYNCCAYEM
jgi:hypothetical protein